MVSTLIIKLSLMDSMEATLTLLIGRILQLNTFCEVNNGFNNNRIAIINNYDKCLLRIQLFKVQNKQNKK
jgi:hypothetical protein